MANSNGFEGIGCFFVGESWQRTIVRSVQPLSPLLCFVSATGQEKQLCLHQCSSRLGINLKLILHMTITISGKKSLVILIKLQTTLFDVLAISNVSFTSLYKGVKTCCLDMQTHTTIYKCQTLLKLFCIKSSLKISYQSSYLRNSRVISVCIWFVLWTSLIVYQVFNLK